MKLILGLLIAIVDDDKKENSFRAGRWEIKVPMKTHHLVLLYC